MSVIAAQPKPQIPQLQSNLQLDPATARRLMINLSGQQTPGVAPANPSMNMLDPNYQAGPVLPQYNYPSPVAALPASPGLQASQDIMSVNPQSMVTGDPIQDTYQKFQQNPQWQAARDNLNRLFAGGMGQGADWERSVKDMFSPDMMKEFDALLAGDSQQAAQLPTGGKDVKMPERFGALDTSSAKGFFTDPRIMSALVGGLMALAAGESPADALLWGAVGSGASQKFLDDKYKQDTETALAQQKMGIDQQNADARTGSTNAALQNAQTKREEADFNKVVTMYKVPKELQIKYGTMRANYLKAVAAGKQANTAAGKAMLDARSKYWDTSLETYLKIQEASGEYDILGRPSTKPFDANDVAGFANYLAESDANGFYANDPDAALKSYQAQQTTLSNYQAMDATQKTNFRNDVNARYTSGGMSEVQYKKIIGELDKIDNAQ